MQENTNTNVTTPPLKRGRSGEGPVRQITLIIVHCTATKEGKDYTVKDVDRWHRERGFKMIGYHYLIRLDGTIEQGRPEVMVGAHCEGHNQHSIGVCYVGGISADGNPADTRTPQQKRSLTRLLTELKQRYPHAIITGHNTFARKACPCFDAAAEYLSLSNRKTAALKK